MNLDLQSPSVFTMRPSAPEDLQDVIALFNAHTRALTGETPFQAEMFQALWTRKGFDPLTDTRVLLAPDGGVAGYAEVEDTDDPHVVVGFRFRCRPDFWETEAPVGLLDWIETRALQAVPKAPEGAQVVLETSVSALDDRLNAILPQRGFKISRNFYRMAIEFDAPPPAPSWPEGVTVRPFNPDTELLEVVRTYKASFQDHWGYVEMPDETLVDFIRHQMQYMPHYDPNLWFVAMDGARMAGICLCFPKTAGREDTAEVAQLGVRREHRQQGLGLALLRHAFGQFYAAGIRRAILGVDASSLTGATRLYEKAGMHVERKTNVYLRVLREGKEMMTTG